MRETFSTREEENSQVIQDLGAASRGAAAGATSLASSKQRRDSGEYRIESSFLWLDRKWTRKSVKRFLPSFRREMIGP